MSELLHQSKHLCTVNSPDKLRESIAEVAFVGRSNVGKSSVLNALCRQKRLAYTSGKPGCTRTINAFTTGKEGLWLVDLPGYGFARGMDEKTRRQWKGMIEHYLTERPNLRCIFVIIDAKVGPTELDLQMVGWLELVNAPHIVVANKIDRLGKTEIAQQKRSIANDLHRSEDLIYWVSAEKGTGIEALASSIKKLLLEKPE